MREKRTDVNFDEHELHVKLEEGLMIHHLQRPNTNMFNVKFINTNGVCVVTGDVGNWMFCREFHPSADGYVSDGYWLEKLGMKSTQVGTEYNSEETREEIQEGIDGVLEEWGHEGDDLEEAKEYYRGLLNYVEYQESEYITYACDNMPGFMDSEDIPHVRTIIHRLNIVYDAFNEICERLKEK